MLVLGRRLNRRGLDRRGLGLDLARRRLDRRGHDCRGLDLDRPGIGRRGLDLDRRGLVRRRRALLRLRVHSRPSLTGPESVDLDLGLVH